MSLSWLQWAPQVDSAASWKAFSSRICLDVREDKVEVEETQEQVVNPQEVPITTVKQLLAVCWQVTPVFQLVLDFRLWQMQSILYIIK